jgi:hypothetical protein
MKGRSAIVMDVERQVTPEALAESYGLDANDPNDLTDGIVQKLDDEGVRDVPTLRQWSLEWVGRDGIWDILERLRVKFDRKEPSKALLDKWFSYYGVGEQLQPQVRPDQLTEKLIEIAQEVAAKPAKLDALRLMETLLTSLMRYTSLFYLRELKRSGQLGQLGKSGGDDLQVIGMLEELSLSELCKLLNCSAPLKARPYDPASKQKVTLSSGDAGASLSRLAHLAGSVSAWSPGQSEEFSDCLMVVLQEWHGEDPYTPKACVVAKILEDGFTKRLTCYDEMGGTVFLKSETSSLTYGDDVLLRSRDEGEVWASRPQAVPKSAAWGMPENMPAKGTGDRTVKRKIRDQVFISYSHADRRWLKELQKYLGSYATIEVWDDTRIKAGAPWKESIERALASAKVAVLLVTPDFLNSDFIAQSELPPLLEAAKSENVTILWVPVSYSSYRESAIEAYQAARDPEKPLDLLTRPSRGKAWVEICDLIKQEYQR